MNVRVGLDRLVAEDFRPLRGRRVGLVSHAAAVDARFRSAVQLLRDHCPKELVRLFGPEHGLSGTAQDLIPVTSELPDVVSLYGATYESLKPQRLHFQDLDLLVIDLVDVGSRYYTFQATMLFCLEAASAIGLPVLLLDRPNPINGITIEGPGVQAGFESFVGPHNIPTRHGLTLGELAKLYRAERQLDLKLEVYPCQSWRREMFFAETGCPWVLPSPNMPTPDTAIVYPGQCLLEGTDLSEGRGTTRPFELFGGVFAAEAVAYEGNLRNFGGVYFRACQFRPTFHKYAGRDLPGIQLHVTDARRYTPVRVTLAILEILRRHRAYRWRTEPYEFVENRPAIDILFGSDRERIGLENGVRADDLAQYWLQEEADFRERRQPFLLY
jgi:uncharacterized protein YbbC (DUF1343 family)